MVKKLAVAVFLAFGFCGATYADPIPKNADGGEAALTTTVRRVISSGMQADVGWDDEDGLAQTFLMVASDVSNRVGVAFVAYNRTSFDPASQVCTADPVLGTYCHYSRATYEAATFNIDASDAHITNATGQLNTDLANATNVFYSSCTYDDVTGAFDCTTAPSVGTITLQWQRTNTDSSKGIGIFERKTGTQTLRISGSLTQVSADTNGSIFGNAVIHRRGDVGTTHNVTIEVLRTH